MSKRETDKPTLSLRAPRKPDAARSSAKAGVRVVRARIRSGESPAAPVPADKRPGTSDSKGVRRDGSEKRPRRGDAEQRPRSRPSDPGRAESDRPRRDTGAARPWGAPPSASLPAKASPRRGAPAVDAARDAVPRRRRERAVDDAPQRRSEHSAAKARPRPAPPPSDAETGRTVATDDTRVAASAPISISADGLVRVSKLLSERGLCSRREADEYIERGWVYADGERVTQLGTRVSPTAELRLDRGARAARARLVTILLHKPVGYVSGQPEDDHPPAMALIRPENLWEGSPPSPGSDRARFEPLHLRGLAPAGRLDIESTGLLAFTQDGTVARQLVGADSQVDKEYLVRVEGQMLEGGLDLLNHGLELDDQPLRPARVEWLNDDQLRFVLNEGRKRQIRRMCELVGLRVTGLKRVRIGRVMLGDLPVGQWRYLAPDEHF